MMLAMAWMTETMAFLGPKFQGGRVSRHLLSATTTTTEPEVFSVGTSVKVNAPSLSEFEPKGWMEVEDPHRVQYRGVLDSSLGIISFLLNSFYSSNQGG